MTAKEKRLFIIAAIIAAIIAFLYRDKLSNFFRGDVISEPMQSSSIASDSGSPLFLTPDFLMPGFSAKEIVTPSIMANIPSLTYVGGSIGDLIYEAGDNAVNISNNCNMCVSMGDNILQPASPASAPTFSSDQSVEAFLVSPMAMNSGSGGLVGVGGSLSGGLSSF